MKIWTLEVSAGSASTDRQFGFPQVIKSLKINQKIETKQESLRLAFNNWTENLEEMAVIKPKLPET